jgi:hypothetical protein
LVAVEKEIQAALELSADELAGLRAQASGAVNETLVLALDAIEYTLRIDGTDA